LKPITARFFVDGAGADASGPPAGRSPLGSVLLVLLKTYQLVFSPFYAGSCRFVPSCSVYAMEAVRVHGSVRGSWLALRRLARCHPLCRGGFDPVPRDARESGVGPDGRKGRL
jgi:putative membrane protein insertion efficiency factor